MDEALRGKIQALANTNADLGQAEGLPRKPDDQPAFEVVWKPKFKASLAAQIISADDTGYEGIRNVLFGGFCGWVVSPDDDILQTMLMMQNMSDHIASTEAEFEVSEKLNPVSALFAGLLALGTDFLEDAYYPLGGHAGLAAASNRPSIERWLSGQKRAVETLVKTMGYLHFAAENLGDRAIYRPMSQNQLVLILEALGDNELVSRSTFLERWSQSQPTLSLLYAASTLKVKGKTLLESFFLGETNFSSLGSQFNEWLSRARYFCDHVVAALPIDGLYNSNVKVLKDFKNMSFAPPQLSALERETIENVLKLKTKR